MKPGNRSSPLGDAVPIPAGRFPEKIRGDLVFGMKLFLIGRVFYYMFEEEPDDE